MKMLCIHIPSLRSTGISHRAAPLTCIWPASGWVDDILYYSLEREAEAVQLLARTKIKPQVVFFSSTALMYTQDTHVTERVNKQPFSIKMNPDSWNAHKHDWWSRRNCWSVTFTWGSSLPSAKLQKLRLSLFKWDYAVFHMLLCIVRYTKTNAAEKLSFLVTGRRYPFHFLRCTTVTSHVAWPVIFASNIFGM